MHTSQCFIEQDGLSNIASMAADYNKLLVGELWELAVVVCFVCGAVLAEKIYSYSEFRRYSCPRTMVMQDLGSTGFNIEAPIHGDVTIGIWLGGHKRDRDVPAFAYQFHTAMLDQDQVRFT